MNLSLFFKGLVNTQMLMAEPFSVLLKTMIELEYASTDLKLRKIQKPKLLVL